MGLTALSVLSAMTLRTPVSSAASMTFRAPITLVMIASMGSSFVKSTITSARWFAYRQIVPAADIGASTALATVVAVS